MANNPTNEEQIRRNNALKVEILAQGAPEQTATTIIADLERKLTAAVAEGHTPYQWMCTLCGFESNNHIKCPSCGDGILVRA